MKYLRTSTINKLFEIYGHDQECDKNSFLERLQPLFNWANKTPTSIMWRSLLGHLDQFGNDDVEQEVKQFTKRAKEYNCHNSQVWLAIRYFNGDGVTKCENTGMKFLRQAADQGNSLALRLMNVWDDD